MSMEHNPEMLAIELAETGAIELSEDDLDTVAGGFSLGSLTEFLKKTSTIGQVTQAGPEGATTASMVNIEEILSKAGQQISF